MSKNNNTLRAYLTTLYQHTRTQLPKAFLLVLLTSLTDGVGLLLLVPLLALAGLEAGNHLLTEHLHTMTAWTGISFNLTTVLLIYVGLISLRAILVFARDTFLCQMEHEFVDALRDQLHQAIGQTSWLFLLQQRSSDLIHTLTTDISRVGYGARITLNTLSSSGLVLAYLAVSLYLSPGMTLTVLSSAGLLFWVLRHYRNRAQQLGIQQIRTGQNLFASVSEFLQGIKLIKSYSAEGYYRHYFARTVAEQRRKALDFNRANSLAQQVFHIGAALLLGLYFYLALAWWQIALTEMIILAIIFARFMPLLSSLQRNYEQIMHMLPAYSAAMQLYQDCQAVAEPPADATQPRLALQQAIRLDAVSFHYQADKPTLSQITTQIPAGQTTAIVGLSGAGKSTLADLLAGLIAPCSGHLNIDATPLTADTWQAWRPATAYVPQEPFLFHDSLRNNLRWASPDSTDDALWQALELAAASSFCRQLPDGLDTIIGERGVRLSGGEKQRVALARALLRQPSLLLLDEATSALDNQHESQIQTAIEQLHGKLTIVLIAHRLSTVRHADQILVLNQGQLVQQGTWTQLCQDQQGHFYQQLKPQTVF
jgi:ATP-binding cassette subfamily C protein